MATPAPSVAPKLIDPQALSRLRGVALRAQTVADGILQGLHKSPHQGASIEFAEHKEYAPGDEIKHVDWKAFARLDKYYVKKYEHETNLQSMMVIDSSASMGYGADGFLTKYEYACVFATSLGYLLLKQQDAVGLLRFDEKVTEFIPPRASNTHLVALAAAMEKAKPRDKTSLETALHTLAGQMKKRGLVMVFSDFFGPSEAAFKALSVLSQRGHDVTCLQVLDGDELTFPFQEMTLFEGLESDTKLLVEPQIVRREYLERLKAHQDDVKRRCLEARAGYMLLDTREAPGAAVMKFLRERQQGQAQRGR